MHPAMSRTRAGVDSGGWSATSRVCPAACGTVATCSSSEERFSNPDEASAIVHAPEGQRHSPAG